MARIERSAGFVLFYQPPEPSEGAGELQFLLLDHGRHWDFPKGHVDAWEDALTAALREVREETGITQVRVVPGFRHEIEYHFRHPKRGLIRKTVIFFLGQTDALDVEISHEHVGAEF